MAMNYFVYDKFDEEYYTLRFRYEIDKNLESGDAFMALHELREAFGRKDVVYATGEENPKKWQRELEFWGDEVKKNRRGFYLEGKKFNHPLP
ncbi:MAG: hypothetical protein IJS54_00930 [Desulfovibrio sp.]|nr:hypothetical protein [Desulfovibrio sp.]